MAQWISACLFALSANIDNFPIGIAYGLRGMRIGAGGNLLIACLTSMYVRVQPDTSCGRRRCGQAVRRRASGQVCGSMLGGAHCGAGRLRTFYLTRLIPDNLPALSIDFPFLQRL